MMGYSASRSARAICFSPSEMAAVMCIAPSCACVIVCAFSSFICSCVSLREHCITCFMGYSARNILPMVVHGILFRSMSCCSVNSSLFCLLSASRLGLSFMYLAMCSSWCFPLSIRSWYSSANPKSATVVGALFFEPSYVVSYVYW